MYAIWIGGLPSSLFEIPSERCQALLHLFVWSVVAHNPDGDLPWVWLQHFSAKIRQTYFCKGDRRERRWSNLSALLSNILPFETRLPIGVVSLDRVNNFLALQKSEPILLSEPIEVDWDSDFIGRLRRILDGLNQRRKIKNEKCFLILQSCQWCV